MSVIEEKSGRIGWHQKIGNRIVLTVIIAAVLPLILLGGMIAIKVRLDLVKQTIASQKTLSATLLHGISALFHNYRRQIETVTVLPAVQSMQLSQQQPVIHEFLDQQRVFWRTIYDTSGEVKMVAIRNRKDEVKDGADGKIDPAGEGGMSKAFNQVIKNQTGRALCQ